MGKAFTPNIHSEKGKGLTKYVAEFVVKNKYNSIPKKVVELVKDELENYHYLIENFNIHLKVPLGVDVEVGTSFGNGVEYEI